MDKEIKIIVATHKKCEMPKDRMYLPLHVGAAGKKDERGEILDFGFERDDRGENISEKNHHFGTQTGLYWMWKNLDAQYKGLVHYRRYFVGVRVKKKDMIGSVISYEEMKPLLNKYRVFVPKKRRYYIETIASHYAHTHDEKHFQLVREIIEKDCAEYLQAFDLVMNRTWGYMFNMMIMETNLIDNYCSWLFHILFQVEEKIDTDRLTEFESRFCGRISEILFDVWLERKIEEGLLDRKEIKELAYIEEVDWFFKIKAFLAAKFFNRKYRRSS